MKTKRKKVIISMLIILGIAFAICVGIVASVKSNLLNYDDITFNYGKDNNAVYYEFASRGGLDIKLNTLVTQNQRDNDGKVIASKMYIWVGGQTNPSKEETQNYFEEILNSEQATVEWVFIFKDKTITVLNGEYQN